MKTKINHLPGAVFSLLVSAPLIKTRIRKLSSMMLLVMAGASAQAQSPPAGMALIPAGSFTMGDSFSEGPGTAPTHSVYVSAFYMDQHEATKALWDGVYNWAISHGYSFDYAGSGKAADHPVQTISWFDAVKFCNARSEMENKTPAYYTDAKLKVRYKKGQVAPYVNWNTGYRLPTEAEWEKAARGGASGHRFSWSDTDDITHDDANYNSTTDYAYDISPTRGYHPAFYDGVAPFTSPVGSFAANDYGLFDMTGNVFEWCYDWSGAYSSSAVNDPHGPATGTFRILRGGSWDANAGWCRAAARTICNGGPFGSFNFLGFRSVLPAGQ